MFNIRNIKIAANFPGIAMRKLLKKETDIYKIKTNELTNEVVTAKRPVVEAGTHHLLSAKNHNNSMMFKNFR